MFFICSITGVQRPQETPGMDTNADELSMAEKAQVSAEHSYLAKG